ncbi:MAG TPA: DegT/DnrJ/EryC1/StrS family aminotransferase, partial [Pirellulaceae bacterium]|nr:DegT/DnrJ/EryC1/StrS family aminotransferase [Pirellulaceae bacterium]
MKNGQNRQGQASSRSAGKLAASVPLLDVNRATAELRDELIAAVTRVVDSGRFLFGPDVTALEQSIARLCGVEHAISCASGSDSLLLALMALDIGDG